MIASTAPVDGPPVPWRFRRYASSRSRTHCRLFLAHPAPPGQLSAMHRFFNTAGPVRPERDYCVPPLERFDLDMVLGLIRNDRYFVLHAPRQTGKDILPPGVAGPAEQRCGR